MRVKVAGGLRVIPLAVPYSGGLASGIYSVSEDGLSVVGEVDTESLVEGCS
jgi:hypothetical protein